MVDKSYVIRGNHYGYNDECFYVCGTSINAVYHVKEDAVKEYKRLQVEFLREMDISDQEEFWDAEESTIKKMNAFMQARVGRNLLEGDYFDWATHLPSELSDEDVLDFGETFGVSAYKLAEYDKEPDFYVLWDCGESVYQKDYDECYEGLRFAENRQELLSNLDDLMYDRGWHSMVLSGTLEEISDNKMLLNALIATMDCLSYCEEKLELRIKDIQADQLDAVNALLRTALFEVRTLKAEELKALDYDEESGEWC